MAKHWRASFAVLVVSLLGIFWFVGLDRWDAAKDQRNDMRRFRSTLKERVLILEQQQVVIDPNENVVVQDK